MYCVTPVGPTLAGGIDLQTSLHQFATQHNSHSKLLHNIFCFNIFLAVQTFSLNIFYRRKQVAPAGFEKPRGLWEVTVQNLNRRGTECKGRSRSTSRAKNLPAILGPGMLR